MSSDRALAAALWCARQQGGAVAKEAADGISGADQAYAVQRESWSLAGMARGGWKVGATSAFAQERLGLTAPAIAPMWAPELAESPTAFAMPADQYTSVESEFAFRFGADLPARAEPYDMDEVLEAVEAVLPAIEIVGCRFEGGFVGLGAERLISDLVANKAWVHGPSHADWRGRDYKDHAVGLTRGGETIAEGTGSAALGDPFNVLKWTADTLSAMGEGLAAGEVVTTGTCTGIEPVSPGDIMVADFGDLGSVEIRFEAA